MKLLAISILSLLASSGPDGSETAKRDQPTTEGVFDFQSVIETLQAQDAKALDPLQTPNLGQPPRHCDHLNLAADEPASGSGSLLKREPATPDAPYLIYAVDRREAGCSVMVMKGNIDDVRPLPKPMDGPLEVIPAGK